MISVVYILIGLVALVALWLITSYNKLVHLKALVHEAWSSVDVQLKRRYDLIPHLVQIVKSYQSHEQQVLENITRYRTLASQAPTLQDRAQAEQALTQSLRSLFAVVENYPDLKANQNYLQLHKDLVAIEDALQLSRRYYNGVVREYNVQVLRVPSNIVAHTFGFEKEQYFMADADERQVPTLNL